MNFEEARIRKECTNPFATGFIINYALTPIENYAVRVIGMALGFNPKKYLNFAITIGAWGLKNAYGEGVFGSRDFEKKVYYWPLEEEGVKALPSKMYEISLGVSDYYNLMLEECGLSGTDSIEFAISYYVQSFVDSFNERENGTQIPFLNKTELRKLAMRTNNSLLLKLLNDTPYLVGFTQSSPVAAKTQEDLEALILRIEVMDLMNESK